MSSKLAFTVVVPAVAGVHDAVEGYLRTSPFGHWVPEGGDQFVRRYRRGRWKRNRRGEAIPDVERLAEGFICNSSVERTANRQLCVVGPPVQLITEPDRRGGSEWPVTLETVFRPTAECVTVGFEFENLAGSWSKYRDDPGFLGWFLVQLLDFSQRYVKRCIFFFLAEQRYSQCAASEIDAISAHLTDCLGLTSAPSVVLRPEPYYNPNTCEPIFRVNPRFTARNA